MKWKEAVGLMYGGGKVTRKSWTRDDFLYFRRGVLYCDGDYPYLAYLKNTLGEWYEWEEYNE